MKDSNRLEGQISGKTRKRTHLLRNIEDKLIAKLAPLVPPQIETYHLTLATIPLSILLLLFGHWSLDNKLWLIGIAVVIQLHYLTDILDGEIGRRRNTGLVKWGFYTDHMLDLLFTGALSIAYSLSFPEIHFAVFAIFIFSALFFLDASTLALVGKKYITSGFLGKISPTELTQLIFLITLGMFFIPDEVVKILFAASAIFFLIAISVQIYIHSNDLWKQDLEDHPSK